MFNLICLNAEGVSISRDRYDDVHEAVIKGRRVLSEEDSRLVKSAYVIEHEVSLTSTGLVSVFLQHRWFGPREKEPEEEEPRKVYVLVSVNKYTGATTFDSVITDKEVAVAWVEDGEEYPNTTRSYYTRRLGEI